MERCERDGTIASDEYRAAMMEYMKRHGCTIDPLPDVFVESVNASAEDDTVTSTIFGGVTVTGPLVNLLDITSSETIVHYTGLCLGKL
jgi:hypothetical protein